jgi:hypothetical protein
MIPLIVPLFLNSFSSSHLPFSSRLQIQIKIAKKAKTIESTNNDIGGPNRNNCVIPRMMAAKAAKIPLIHLYSCQCSALWIAHTRWSHSWCGSGSLSHSLPHFVIHLSYPETSPPIGVPTPYTIWYSLILPSAVCIRTTILCPPYSQNRHHPFFLAVGFQGGFVFSAMDANQEKKLSLYKYVLSRNKVWSPENISRPSWFYRVGIIHIIFTTKTVL